jgi:hypothetical protein
LPACYDAVRLDFLTTDSLGSTLELVQSNLNHVQCFVLQARPWEEAALKAGNSSEHQTVLMFYSLHDLRCHLSFAVVPALNSSELFNDRQANEMI